MILSDEECDSEHNVEDSVLHESGKCQCHL